MIRSVMCSLCTVTMHDHCTYLGSSIKLVVGLGLMPHQRVSVPDHPRCDIGMMIARADYQHIIAEDRAHLWFGAM